MKTQIPENILITQTIKLFNIHVFILLSTIVFITFPSARAGLGSNEDIYVEKAKIEYTPLLDILQQQIIPLAIENGFKAKNDLIFISQEADKLTITIIVGESLHPGWVYNWRNYPPYYKVYYLKINNIPIYFCFGTGSVKVVQNLKQQQYIGKDDDRRLWANDNQVTWVFKISDDYFRCIYEEDFGCSWLKDPESRKYIPALPYLIMPEELRDLPFIRTETAERPQRAAIPIN